VNPEIGSSLKHSCKQSAEKTVGEVRNLRDGTRRKPRNLSFDGKRETGNREWTLAVMSMRGRLWKTPGEAIRHFDA
jgi:hypothetical protein